MTLCGNTDHLDPGPAGGYQRGVVGGAVTDDGVDLRQRGDADEGDPSQLALVCGHDDPVGTAAGGPLHPALGLVVVGDTAVTVDAGHAHDEGVAVVVGQRVFDSGADEAVLETEVTNIGALRLYEGLGFVRDKRLMKYYLNGSDAYRLKVWFPNHREG